MFHECRAEGIDLDMMRYQGLVFISGQGETGEIDDYDIVSLTGKGWAKANELGL